MIHNSIIIIKSKKKQKKIKKQNQNIKKLISKYNFNLLGNDFTVK